jgi:amino acid transporter
MFTFFVFFSAFLLEGIGTYVSVIGLGALFAYSMVVMTMAVALDIAKVTTVTFLYRHWKEIGWRMKTYMLSAVIVLMTITSAGVFGFLSGEFQKAIAGTSQQGVLIQSLSEEQTRLQKRKEEIDKQIAQLPQNNVSGRRVLIRQFGPEVQRINDRLVEIDKQLPQLKIENIEKETHVGPIMYVAEAFDTTPEKAVKWVNLTIIGVFDPLAIALLVAGNFLLAKRKKEAHVETPPVEKIPEVKIAPPIEVEAPIIEAPVPVATPTVAQEPVREKTVKKPEPPKVVVKTEGDKEVITLQKPLMKSSLEDIRGAGDFSTDKSTARSSNVYKD